MEDSEISVEKLFEHDIVTVLETFIEHKSSEIRHAVVKVVAGIVYSYNVEVFMSNEYIVKQVIERFPKENDEYQHTVCMIFLSLVCIHDDKDILDFFVKY